MTASRQHRRLGWTGFVLGLAGALHVTTAGPVAAADVKVGGRPLSFEPSPGYCLYEKSRPMEEKAIAGARRLSEPTEIAIWVFGECARRDQWFSLPPGQTGVVFVTKRQAIFHAAETLPRAEFVAEMARQPWRTIYADMDTRSQKFGVNSKTHSLQIIAKDNDALYIGASGTITIRNIKMSFINVTALTTVNSLPVSFELSVPSGQTPMTVLLELQKTNVRNLIARNEQAATRASNDIEQSPANIATQ